jgi:hypothetical protein
VGPYPIARFLTGSINFRVVATPRGGTTKHEIVGQTFQSAGRLESLPYTIYFQSSSLSP